MAIYVYAVADAASDLDGLRGVRDSVLRAVRHEEVEAVVSDLDSGLTEISEDDLWAHETVVEELMEGGAVLPMRFGTVVAGDSELVALLRDHAVQLQDGLKRVRGAVEVGVRALLEEAGPSMPEPRPETGSDYLLGRVESHRRAREGAQLIHDTLSTLARESSFRVREEGAAQLQSSYLVDRDSIESFSQRVEELDRDRVAAALICTGPWPPYSFTDVRLGG
jgi:hypothetical protein